MSLTELPDFLSVNPSGDIVWVSCSDRRAGLPQLANASLHEIRRPGGLLSPELGSAGALSERVSDLVNEVATMVRIKTATMVVVVLHDHCAAQQMLNLDDVAVVQRAQALVAELKERGVSVPIFIVHKRHCEAGVHLGWHKHPPGKELRAA